MGIPEDMQLVNGGGQQHIVMCAGTTPKTTDGMYKFMIFALDLGEARKKQSKLPKTLDDFKHKTCDALGVDSDDQRVEAIFAGYQVLLNIS